MANATIVSLGMLKVNWDRLGKGYLDNFVPIVAESVKLLPHDQIALPELREKIQSEFGLNLPGNSIDTILRRAKKYGYVKVEHGMFVRDCDQLSKLNFREAQTKFLTEYEALVSSLVQYCMTVHRVTWTPQEAENAILAYLQVGTLVISRESLGTIIPPTAAPGANAQYLVCDFIRYLMDTFSPQFGIVETIVKGNMLANAIFLSDPMQAEKRFRDTFVYFDSGFLVNALGYAGSERQQPCKELLDLLFQTGANLRCFSHTVDEIRGILDAAAKLIREDRTEEAYGPLIPSVEYFVSRNNTASDIELFGVQLPRHLKALRIEVVKKPPYVGAAFEIDENALEKKLRADIQYTREKTLARDRESISAITRLRRGHTCNIVEECWALFVTTNVALAKSCRDYFCTSDEGISPCLTDYTLTNLLWLKTPLKAPDLPRKRIIADCYAAIQPDERLWMLYLAEIKKLEESGDITSDDYYLLRRHIEVKQALMELTNGDENALTHASITELLDMLKERMTADLRAELDEQKRLRKESEEAARADQAQLQMDMSGEIAHAEARAYSAEARESQRDVRITLRAQVFAHWVSVGIQVVLFLVLIVGGVFSFPKDFPVPSLGNSFLGYLGSAAALVLMVMSIISISKGTFVKTSARGIESWVARKTKQLLRRILT